MLPFQLQQLFYLFWSRDVSFFIRKEMNSVSSFLPVFSKNYERIMKMLVFKWRKKWFTRDLNPRSSVCNVSTLPIAYEESCEQNFVLTDFLETQFIYQQFHIIFKKFVVYTSEFNRIMSKFPKNYKGIIKILIFKLRKKNCLKRDLNLWLQFVKPVRYHLAIKIAFKPIYEF